VVFNGQAPFVFDRTDGESPKPSPAIFSGMFGRRRWQPEDGNAPGWTVDDATEIPVGVAMENQLRAFCA
jgi:hypothetical protein